MAHDCPECGELCYCDIEDHMQAAPEDCRHSCPPEPLEDDFDPDPPSEDQRGPSAVYHYDGEPHTARPDKTSS